MIEGFEFETSPLTEYEETTLLPFIVSGLSKKVGEEMAVKSHTMIRAARNRGMKIDGSRLRKIINHIRVNGLIELLVATSKGYYIEPDPQLFNKYIKSLNQRIAAIEAVRDAMVIQLHKNQ